MEHMNWHIEYHSTNIAALAAAVQWRLCVGCCEHIPHVECKPFVNIKAFAHSTVPRSKKRAMVTTWNTAVSQQAVCMCLTAS